MADIAADDEIPPNSTVYVKNLEERIKIPTLIESLRGIFAEYGNIVDIVARKNLKAKGQAFVVFDSVDSAQNAIDEVNGFELFDKQIQCEFAKTKSDATIAREGTAEELDQHKQKRLAEKARRQAAAEAAEIANKKRAAPADQEPEGERATKTARGTGLKGAGASAPGLVPDEYLPPNKILFVRQLPEDYGVDEITELFGFPGFREVRLVPTRKAIAFVEFENETFAVRAKGERDGKPYKGVTLKVTYQRQ